MANVDSHALSLALILGHLAKTAQLRASSRDFIFRYIAFSQPADVFFPGYQKIDLRYRLHAQARLQTTVAIAQVNHSDSECARNYFNLSYLLQSIEPLYPSLRGIDEPGQVSLGENIQDYDLAGR